MRYFCHLSSECCFVTFLYNINFDGRSSSLAVTLNFLISQVSVITQLRWGGNLYHRYIDSFFRKLAVKEFWKLVYVCRSYHQKLSFFDTQCIWCCVVSGLSCVTVISAEGAAMHAAEVFALTDHIMWSKLRAARLNLWIGLRHADKKMQQRLEVDKKLWWPNRLATGHLNCGVILQTLKSLIAIVNKRTNSSTNVSGSQYLVSFLVVLVCLSVHSIYTCLCLADVLFLLKCYIFYWTLELVYFCSLDDVQLCSDGVRCVIW